MRWVFAVALRLHHPLIIQQNIIIIIIIIIIMFGHDGAELPLQAGLLILQYCIGIRNTTTTTIIIIIIIVM